MSTLFVESSALVKRYAPEIGSDWIDLQTDVSSHNVVILAEITLVEVAAALQAKTRTLGGLSTLTRDQATLCFLQDCRNQFLLIPVFRPIVDLAMTLAQRHSLRGYDAVPLSACLTANHDIVSQGQSPLILISADQELLKAAQAEGLAVDDPNLHP